jgi:hypothetical protein
MNSEIIQNVACDNNYDDLANTLYPCLGRQGQ